VGRDDRPSWTFFAECTPHPGAQENGSRIIDAVQRFSNPARLRMVGRPVICPTSEHTLYDALEVTVDDEPRRAIGLFHRASCRFWRTDRSRRLGTPRSPRAAHAGARIRADIGARTP